MKITDEIFFNDNTYCIIKVNDEDFCYVYSADFAMALIDSLTKTLVKEFEEQPEVKRGWKKISFARSNPRTVVISEQELGRIYNGPQKVIRTLTFTEICRGYLG